MALNEVKSIVSPLKQSFCQHVKDISRINLSVDYNVGAFVILKCLIFHVNLRIYHYSNRDIRAISDQVA